MSPRSDDGIVITGVGAWCCLGRGAGALGDGLATGERRYRRIEGMRFIGDPWFPTDHAFQVTPEPAIDSRLDGSRQPVRLLDWPTAMAVETALDAWVDAGLGHGDGGARGGVFNGTSQGANHGLIEYLDRKVAGEHPDARLLPDSAAWVARQIARRSGARGPNITINTACSSSVNSIGIAAHLLRAGRIDRAIAGGNDSFSLLSFAGFSSLRAVDPHGCRPFDVDRAGMSLGDGAAYVVLEREGDARRRGARIRARLTGYACAGEGYHPTAPDPEGRGAYAVMSLALEQDGRATDLGFVSAHGTGTRANDEVEVSALGRIVERFGIAGPVRVASIKSQLGHTLGAAGALQVVAAVVCLERALVPATIGLRTPIAATPTLVFPREPSTAAVDLVLCSSFGFAGSCAALTVRPPAAG